VRIFNFILGVLGVLLVIGAFSSFFALFLLGGIATGSVTFAFGLPILLIVLGAAMAYFGFYYKELSNNGNSKLITIVKWGIVSAIALLISDFIITKLVIVNNFWAILLTAAVVSIVIQAVRSHDNEFSFKMRWFIFYFLVYATVIWVMGEYFLPKIAFQTGIFSSIVIGFTIAGIIVIIQKIGLRSHTVPWVSIVLVLILVVANLGYLQDIIPIDLPTKPQNASAMSEDKQVCPTPKLQNIWVSSEADFNSNSIMLTLNSLVDTSVWRIEHNFGSCYKGKYRDQNPSWYYCDDMIISRWATGSSGTINYRWYTAVTAEWRPERVGSNTLYVFDGFSCENGKKVTVDKETTAYYVYVSRDGTEIKVEY